MSTYSSILAWRIPRTEEPGGLQFMELDITKELTLSLYFSYIYFLHKNGDQNCYIK